MAEDTKTMNCRNLKYYALSTHLSHASDCIHYIEGHDLLPINDLAKTPDSIK